MGNKIKYIQLFMCIDAWANRMVLVSTSLYNIVGARNTKNSLSYQADMSFLHNLRAMWF